ncbi:MAG TPA: DinB family protein, partial [Phototrophicaceae bacterium]|nr:DinB family protein [Phototrophicaceae bacterium]
GGQQIVKRIASMPENKRNHSVITHIIGIEKWSQRRIRVALGEPFVDEEYTGYRPAKNTGWVELIPLFEATRRETIALVNQLDPSMLKQRVLHNGYGNITIGAWLRYVDVHSSFECRKLR